jgi:DNA-binding response OmpR family regulator
MAVVTYGISGKKEMHRILIAEDDKNFGAVLKNELQEEGYTVDLVGDGVEAVFCVIDNPTAYAVAIFDIKMPKLDGIHALRIARRLDRNLPVIAISGNAGSAEMTAARAAGALHCLAKPFGIAKLKEIITATVREGNKP